MTKTAVCGDTEKYCRVEVLSDLSDKTFSLYVKCVTDDWQTESKNKTIDFLKNRVGGYDNLEIVLIEPIFII